MQDSTKNLIASDPTFKLPVREFNDPSLQEFNEIAVEPDTDGDVQPQPGEADDHRAVATTTGHPANGRLEIPPRKPFLISNEHRYLLEYVDSVVAKGGNINILIKGLSGCGKSELVTQYAATRQRPLAQIEVGYLAEASQIFGSKTLVNGSIVYQEGIFTRAITTPGCVIHLQEINRPETDKALNAIFSVLDETFRSVWLDELDKRVKVAPGVVFFATMNEGYQFIGTQPVDEALANRFALRMELGYLPEGFEQSLLIMRSKLEINQARDLVRVANSLRSNSQNPVHISTRNLIAIAELVKFGASLYMALKSTLEVDTQALEQIMLSLHLAGHDMKVGESNQYGMIS